MDLWNCGTLVGIISLIRCYYFISVMSFSPKPSNFAITPTFTYFQMEYSWCVDGHRRLILSLTCNVQATTKPTRFHGFRLRICTIHSLQVFPVICFCCVYTFLVCVCADHTNRSIFRSSCLLRSRMFSRTTNERPTLYSKRIICRAFCY